jgi:hypothetical protein
MTTLFDALGRQTPSNVGTSRLIRAAPSDPALRQSPRHAGSSARQSGPPDIELQAACQVDLARVIALSREIRASVIRDESEATGAATPAAPLPDPPLPYRRVRGGRQEEFARAAAVAAAEQLAQWEESASRRARAVAAERRRAATQWAATQGASAEETCAGEAGAVAPREPAAVLDLPEGAAQSADSVCTSETAHDGEAPVPVRPRRQRGSRGRHGRGRAPAATSGCPSAGEESAGGAPETVAAPASLVQGGRLERAVEEAARLLLRAAHAAERASPSAKRGLLSRASGQVVAALRRATSGDAQRATRRREDQRRARDQAVREARQLQRSNSRQHNQGQSSDGSFRRGNNRTGRRHNHDSSRRAAQSRGPARHR